MASLMKEFEHLKIHLEEITKATDNFGGKVIGSGGFGKVYEGEISHSRGRSMAAIKRLSREFGQGDPEFLKEIVMLSRYKHENLVSLLGYCDEDGEKILVYEHASNGSLDRHLSSTFLTWPKRLKICLDVAKGLTYLHDHKGTQQRVIHRDIKSANILLDDNWNAKLSDMGLSKTGPANQPHTVLFTDVAGTPGYCDPQYLVTYGLTKESDVYSFGVVLFEVLCGRLCFERTNHGQLEILVPLWKQSYKSKTLDQFILKDLRPSMYRSSFETFSDIAFKCLHDSREQRPTMSDLVKNLEIALKFQEHPDMKLPNEVGTSRKSSYVDEMGVFLAKGKEIFLNWAQPKREVAKQKDAEGSDGSTAVDGKGTTSAEADERRTFVHFGGAMGFTADDLLSGSPEVMGKSTYGTVYKVTLKNGDVVAVRKLGENITKDRKEMVVELNLLGKIRHRNLLAMRAYYLGSDKLLVFDYIPKAKGSLAAILHARGPETHVDWATRMKIAKGVARGLHRLHTNHNIVHGNLSSHNVLLDENSNPKISYFGLSLLMTSNANSKKIARDMALGYQAPEFSVLEKADTKTDVYSLGVIILELLTGKSPGEEDLRQWVNMIVRTKWTSEAFDRELMKDVSERGFDELVRTMQVATRCVSKSPQHRHEVQLVLQQLEEITPSWARR